MSNKNPTLREIHLYVQKKERIQKILIRHTVCCFMRFGEPLLRKKEKRDIKEGKFVQQYNCR